MNKGQKSSFVRQNVAEPMERYGKIDLLVGKRFCEIVYGIYNLDLTKYQDRDAIENAMDGYLSRMRITYLTLAAFIGIIAAYMIFWSAQQLKFIYLLAVLLVIEFVVLSRYYEIKLSPALYLKRVINKKYWEQKEGEVEALEYSKELEDRKEKVRNE